MKEIFDEALIWLERLRYLQIDSQLEQYAMAAVLAFGLLNCILGYRLLRFWVMLTGFCLGAGGGYLAFRETFPLGPKLIGVMVLCGLVLGLLVFLLFRAGIFVLGAGMGAVVSVYLMQPKSSAAFFFCLLIGVVIGVLGLRYSREVLIAATSILGGFLASYAILKLAVLEELPYGLVIGIVFSVLGILLQLLINPRKTEEDEEVKRELPRPVPPEELEDDITIDEDAIIAYMDREYDKKE